MFRTTFVHSLGIIGLATILAAPLAWAQESPTVRVRGTIERIEGPIYVIKARDGAELKLTVADKPSIATLVKASLADIKRDSFVGVTSMPQPDGSSVPWRCTFFQRQCVEPEKDTTRGISGRRA